MSAIPDVISNAQTTEEAFLRHIFVRDQMAEWSRQPLIMAKADGVFYWDVHGKRYFDALSGIYVASVGHNNRRVIEAVKKQLDTLHFSPPMHGTNPVAVQLANLLAELAPGDLSTVKFQCGGAEVTEAAIKLARQYHKLTGNPGKYKIISRYLSWHGSTMGSLSASGLKSRKTVNEPLAPGFLHVFPPTCYRCPFGKTYAARGLACASDNPNDADDRERTLSRKRREECECGITCATIVGDVIEMEDAATVAAIMVEPIGHTGGIIDPPEEYLPILREVCDRHNVLLIFDEIITGIGRTGQMFAAQTFGVTPDVICMGKGLSGGFAPLSAMICRRPIADAFWGPIAENPGFVEGHTFEGNPVSCAAGIAVLREILERDLCANARTQGARLRAGFERLAQKHGIIGDIRGKGLFLGMEFVKNPATKERFPSEMAFGVQVGKRALANGLLCRFDPHWLAFGPPLVVTAEQVDEMVGILDRSIVETLASGAA